MSTLLVLATALVTTPEIKSARSTATKTSDCILIVSVLRNIISASVVFLNHVISPGAHG